MQNFKHISIYIISIFVVFTLLFPLSYVIAFDSDSIYVWSDLGTTPVSSSVNSEKNNSSKPTNTNVAEKTRKFFRINFRRSSFN